MHHIVKIENLTKTYTIRQTEAKVTWFGDPGHPAVWLTEFFLRLTGKYNIRKIIAIDHLNLNVIAGEFLGIFGPNGAGKSTLLKILACLLKPSSGKINICGYDLIHEPHEVSKRISYIPGLLLGSGWAKWELSARKNLEFFADLFNLPKNRIDDAIHLAGLEEWADVRVGNFSSGMSARMILAISLLKEAELLLLDEPTTAIDLRGIKEIHEYISYLNKDKGITIIYSTHHAEILQRYADRIAIMDKGKLIALDTPGNLVNSIKKEEVVEIEAKTNLTEQAIKHLENLGGIKVVSKVDDPICGKGSIKIYVNNSRNLLPTILDDLIKHFDIKISDIKMSEPSLEDVFIYLTER